VGAGSYNHPCETLEGLELPVVLRTDQPADSFPITGFEGEPNRFDEDAKGLTNVGETGDPA
jgi:hypothetical protein